MTNHHSGVASQTIRDFVQKKKVNIGAETVTEANCRMIAENALPKDFFDRDGTKTWLKTLSEVFDKPELAKIGTSGRSVGRFLCKNVDSLKSLIQEKGADLAENGNLSLQADHFSSRKSSSESGRDFLGIILNCRDKNHRMRKIPLCFEPAKSHSFAQFRKDLKRVLTVRILALLQI